jgi:hypothetical protein
VGSYSNDDRRRVLRVEWIKAKVELINRAGAFLDGRKRVSHAAAKRKYRHAVSHTTHHYHYRCQSSGGSYQQIEPTNKNIGIILIYGCAKH